MSYILDALKKAEAERKLGSVPDMHAQPLAAAPGGGFLARTRPLAWSALAVLLLIAVAIAWLAPWRTSQQPDAAASSPQQTPSAIAGIDTDPNIAQAAPDRASSIDRAPASAEEAPPQKAVPPEPARAKPAAKPARKAESKPAPAAKKRENTASAVTADASAAAEPRLPRLRDLPENIQREIPALTVGGYIYSGVPSERSILINDRLLREGSEITHGLVLEQMGPKEAVLNYKGYRYRLPY